MKQVGLILLFLGFSTLAMGQKIYQADIPKDASIMVYPVDEPHEAHLWVCFVWEEEELVHSGLWMDMEEMDKADFVIYFVDDEEEANLKIWLVDTPQESKWLDESKKCLLQKE